MCVCFCRSCTHTRTHTPARTHLQHIHLHTYTPTHIYTYTHIHLHTPIHIPTLLQSNTCIHRYNVDSDRIQRVIALSLSWHLEILQKHFIATVKMLILHEWMVYMHTKRPLHIEQTWDEYWLQHVTFIASKSGGQYKIVGHTNWRCIVQLSQRSWISWCPN